MLSEKSISKGDEIVMSNNEEPIIVDDREELAYLIDQEKTVGHTSKAVIEIEDPNFIPKKNE